MKTDIILTNPSGTTGITVARSLEQHGLRVVFMEAPNARKMPDSYIARLHKFVGTYGPDSVWPIFFCDVLAGRRDEFPGVNIPLPPPAVILSLDEKLAACELAAGLGIRQPRRFGSAGEALEWSRNGLSSDGLPDGGGQGRLVFKRTMGLGGDSVYFPGSEKALLNLVRRCGPRNDGASSGTSTTAADNLTQNYLITEYVEGEDVSVDAVRWGDYFFGAAYRVLEPRRKGVSLRRVSIEAPELVAALHQLMQAVDYNGVCGADFRITKDGTAYFLECNPRFSGGLESAVASGFDIPWILWQLSHGITPEPVSFRPGVITGIEL